MAQQIIPFSPSPDANFQFQVELDGAPYTCVCKFNIYRQGYYLFVYDLVGQLIVARPVVASPSFANINLLGGYFDVTMIFRDSSQSFEIPGLPPVPLVRPPVPPTYSYPLDPLVARPAVAYSTRRLLSSYLGPCMRVRRSSDDAEMDIPFLVGELDTATLLSFVGSDIGVVSVWYDQSGNSFDASNSIQAAQPTIVTGGAVVKSNGFPALFVNAQNLNFNNRFAAQNDCTMSAVFSTTQNNPVTDPSHGYAMSGFIYGDRPGVQFDIGFGNLGDKLAYWGGDSTGEVSVIGTTTLNDGKNHVGIVTRISLTGFTTLYLDNTLQATGRGPQGKRTDAPTLQIGSAGIGGEGGYGSLYPGVFNTPENVIYASQLSGADMLLLQQAQKLYYAPT
jgi:hypothetical protein